MKKKLTQGNNNMQALPIRSGRWLFMLLLAAACCMQQSAIAQTVKKITGRIVSQTKDAPLGGTTVAVKGTSKVTASADDGSFSIEAAEGDVLVFSSVGFTKKEIKVGSSNRMEVRLVEDFNNLNDVVVVGYGKMKKTDLSSAQTVVGNVELNRTINTTLEQGLQGRAANVYVSASSGQPGAPPSVMIRGFNSLSGTNQPLYVIDGVQIKPADPKGGMGTSDPNQNVSANILSGINPDDIESMNVLQGPSATAIYGAAGANGVIMISTKRGKSGETKVNFNANVSLQDIPDEVPVMNLKEYATFRNEVAKLALAPYEPTFENPDALGDGTNWQKALMRRTLLQKYSLGLSGGGDKTTFYFGGEYFNQEGVVEGSGFERYSVRLNLDNQTRRWLKIGTNLSVNQTQENVNTTNGDLLNIAIKQNPSIPVKNPDGTWGGPTTTQYQFSNPVALSQINDNRNKSMSFIGGVYADVSFLKNLVWHTEYNAYYQYTNSYIFNPSYEFNGYVNTTTVSTRKSGNNYWWGLNTRLQYNTRIKEKHDITVMAGHEAREWGGEGLYGTRQNFTSNNVQELSGGDAASATNGSNKNKGGEESWFARMNYVYDNKYIVGASFRADASSNFGPNNKWGYFPGVSAAWRISQEAFMQNIKSITDLKLRVEYGTNGNSSASGLYASLSAIPTTWGTGYLASNFPNPAIKWETTKTINLGFDLRMFNNRLEIIGDFYQKKISDLLTTNDFPFSLGGSIAWAPGAITWPTSNVGSMENKGMGFTINTVNIEKPFVWRSGIVISVDRNKITSLYQDIPINSAYNNSSVLISNSVGNPAALITGYIAEGLFNNVDEINAHAKQSSFGANPTQGTWVGDVKFRDISGPDGKPDGVIDENDRVVIGNPWPKFNYGFNNFFSYKNFDLNIFMQGVVGNDVFNYTRFLNENPGGTSPYSNYFKQVANFARPSTYTADAVLTNPETTIPRIVSGDPNGNFKSNNSYIEDGSYLRVKNITLSYNFHGQWLSKIALRGLKASAAVQNAFTFTNYKGYDPEIGMFAGAVKFVGIDNGRYPSVRTYSMSILADF